MSALREAAADLLYAEASFLDRQQWDDWLALYLEECEFWMPAWKSEHALTDDPRRELSLVYYSSRTDLHDRVSRARSGRSVASVPMPRTQHMLSNIVVQQHEDDRACTVYSNWMVNLVRLKQRERDCLFGRYEHELALADVGWRIRKKKIVLMNDRMRTMVDFYMV
jgi:3-phenylpropionate/cinnamic acid dioxygenase small subunit